MKKRVMIMLKWQHQSGTVVEILQDFIEKSQKSKDDEIERKERMHREKLDAINSLVGIIKDQETEIIYFW